MSLSKTLYSPKILVIPGKRILRPDMTEKVLTGTLSFNTNKKQNISLYGHQGYKNGSINEISRCHIKKTNKIYKMSSLKRVVKVKFIFFTNMVAYIHNKGDGSDCTVSDNESSSEWSAVNPLDQYIREIIIY